VDKNLIASKVRAIVVEMLKVNSSEVIDSASFVEDLGADSLDQVELMMEFEDEFSAEISDEDAEKIATVGEAITYISKILEARAPSTED